MEEAGSVLRHPACFRQKGRIRDEPQAFILTPYSARRQQLKDHFLPPLPTFGGGMGTLGLRAPRGQEARVWVLTAAVQALTPWPSRSARQKGRGCGEGGAPQLLSGAPTEARSRVTSGPDSIFSPCALVSGDQEVRPSRPEGSPWVFLPGSL